MIYLDTSYIVKCYIHEPGSKDVLTWLTGKTGLSCCAHGRIELFAAIKRHLREGRLSGAEARRTFGRLESDEAAGYWNWIPFTPPLVRETCNRIARLPGSVYIRSADAMHLACAAESGFREVYSHDRHLLAAASYFGIKAIDVIAR